MIGRKSPIEKILLHSQQFALPVFLLTFPKEPVAARQVDRAQGKGMEPDFWKLVNTGDPKCHDHPPIR